MLLLAGPILLAPPSKVRNPDAEVIQAAADAFFAPKAGRWRDGEWSAGTAVVFEPNYRMKDRASVEATFQIAIRNQREILALRPQKGSRESGSGLSAARLTAMKREARGDLAKLTAALADSRQASRTFVVPPLLPLKTLDLGPRIAVGEVKRDLLKDWHREPLPGGRKGTIRVIGTACPPGYSKGGRYAAFEMSAPWSIHHADVTFILRRENNAWRVLHIESAFYV